jgi:hypothetical protein
MIYLASIIIPTLIALGFFIFVKDKINFKMFVIQVAVQVLVMVAFVALIGWHNTHDVEVWNGRVASKEHHHVSCEHSYSCNPHSCNCDKNGCSTCYDTCYEHFYDVSWYLHTTNDESIKIHREDRQGLREPIRWTAVQIGEPTAVEHSFTNYVKGSPDTLFRKTGLVEKYKDKIPTYPNEIYDYYHLNRLVTVGLSVKDAREWNKDLEELNANLGRAKQVNAIVILTKNMPEDYFYAIEQKWIGGKKNDFTTVINLDESDKVTWSKVMAWTDNKMAETTVADAMVKIGTLDRQKMVRTINGEVETFFVRKHMKDFAYLSNNVNMSMWDWIIDVVLGLTISIGFGIFYLKNDFND